MRALLSPGRLIVSGLALLALAGTVLWLTPSEKYIFLPDEAHPVASFVQVEGERPDRNGGGIYFVDVIVRKATLIERLFPGLRNGSTLVPAEVIRQGVSDRERRRVSRLDMSRSQEVAAAVALRALGYEVRSRSIGVLITVVSESAPAAGLLQPGDIVLAVDGRPVRTPEGLRRRIRTHQPGDVVRLRLRRDARVLTVSVKTIRDPRRGVPVIGILVQEAAKIDLPISVKIDLGEVGGPSAGLAFALDVMEELGRNVDRGYKIAATGQIELDGRVLPIGGIKQKTIGAKEADVDVFLVPAGDNAAEARRYAKGLRIVAVQNFRQALRVLATLPSRA